MTSTTCRAEMHYRLDLKSNAFEIELDACDWSLVKVASNSDGVYLGDERLDPIFAELDKSGALVAA